MYTQFKKQFTFNSLISLFFLSLVLLLFFVSSKKGLVWCGDSIQYLKMAYKTAHFQLPLTDKWMPLYSIFIGLLNVIGFKILTAAFIVNLTLVIASTLLIFNLFITITNGDKFSVLLAGLLIVINREFIMNSLTIMGELPMLFFVILFFVYLAKILKKNKIIKKDIYFLTLIIIFSVFTKYNGLVLLPVLFYLIITSHEGLKDKIYLFLIVLVTIFLPYIIWSIIKSDNDIVLSAIKSNSFAENISINLKDLIITLSEFFLIPRITNSMSNNFSLLNQSLFAVIFILVLISLFIYYYRKNKNGIEIYVLIFMLSYLLSFIYLCSSSGINEVNTRTLFYPLIFSLVYLIILFSNVKSLIVKCIIFTFFSVIFILNCLKLNQTTQRFIDVGYGELSKEYFNNDNQVLENAINIINQNNFKNHQIYSNKHKLLPIFFDFELMNELPTNRQWLGNKNWFLDEKEIMRHMEKVKSKLIINGGAIVYLGKDYKEIYNKFFSNFNNKNFPFKDYFFSDGFIILALKSE